jgi:non-ribosomal peptide synthetase component F
MVAASSRPSELPLLAEAGRRRLVVEWTARVAEYPSDKCIHDLFAESAARTPDAVAVVSEGEKPSDGELNALGVGARPCRTGDLARRRDRYLEFVGRLDHRIEIRGYIISPRGGCGDGTNSLHSEWVG